MSMNKQSYFTLLIRVYSKDKNFSIFKICLIAAREDLRIYIALKTASSLQPKALMTSSAEL
ncbi:MAG: hypothetical protein KatS3mg035_2102 [Bacteroidia bacterium]|nr:MAG: hypothetical protein KatS3mg035_2102 [Bacteroidia bacterium]